MIDVNHDMEEMEFDYYLSLANLFDEGFPSIPHAHYETFSSLPPLGDGIPCQSDTTPKEHAINDVLPWVDYKDFEQEIEKH